MTTGMNIAVFDLEKVNRGDAVRFRRNGDTVFRNGIITRTDKGIIEILHSNVQNTATTFSQMLAADVAIGMWEVFWTTDFVTINYQPSGGI